MINCRVRGPITPHPTTTTKERSRFNMPKVKKAGKAAKEFPYTKKGIADAKKYAKQKGGRVSKSNKY